MDPQTQAPQEPQVTATEPVASPSPQPAVMETPQPATMSGGATTAENPGKGMGLAGLILAFFIPLVGLILSIIGLNKSKKAGMKNGLAVAGIVISILAMIANLVIISMLIAAGASLTAKCSDLGPGTHYVDGVTYTCN